MVATKKQKKILVAEDDASIAEVVSIVLSEEGYAVTVVQNKEAIFDALKNNTPDMMLLDIWLSGFDGGKVAGELKSNPKTRSIPIVIMSAKNDTKQVAQEAGADDFLLKPFDIEELLSFVKKHMQK